ncbi:hypothetical protein DBV39_02000 [Orrella marina]|uniref:Uncharacterized protein n=2 Tax=Orrella marina TaxID=2163011 RepID=A0A2R4XFV2_9BURK|nr:hypothetical protein DBV39_02000 [Orrella marina]
MLAERFEQTNARMLDAIEQLCGKSGRSQGEMLDESGEIQTSFEQTLDAISMIIDQQRAARESAVRDRELNHEDGVVESFDRFISALIEAHDLINELKWAIMEHDADRSPSSGKGPFRSAKELLASFQ